MNWNAKGFIVLVTLSVVMLMAVSACSEPPPPTPTPVPMPMLNADQAMMVVVTDMAQDGSLVRAVGGDSPFRGCVLPGWSPGDPLTTEASYQNNGKWTVQVGGCLFVVDDYTGQVSGP